MAEKVQLIVARPRVTCMYFQAQLPVGAAVWVDKKAATLLLEQGVCSWPDGQVAAEPKLRGDVPRERPAGGAAATGKPLERKPGWPVDRYSLVHRVWDGRTVVCVGAGPSTTQEALDLVRRAGVPTIVANDIYLVAPWADVHYFADYTWWVKHSVEGISKKFGWCAFTAEQQRASYHGFTGQRCTIEETGARVADQDVHMLHNSHMSGLSHYPDTIAPGGNSGYQIVNIALLAGARRVLLLGYDMRFANGRSHAHNGHPTRTPEGTYGRFAKRFDTMLPPLKEHFPRAEVVNCTPGSLIKCFRRSTLQAELHLGEEGK